MRGTGRTTKQMQDAPYGAIYICLNEPARYECHLAIKIGRTDLCLRSLRWLNYWRIHGLKVPIVIDHAIELSKEQHEMLLVHKHSWQQ